METDRVRQRQRDGVGERKREINREIERERHIKARHEPRKG